MRRKPVCADKWRGKEIVYLPHFPRRAAQILHYTRTSNRFKIFHHVDLSDYLIFAQDDRAEKCTTMPEARVIIITPFVFLKTSDLSRQFCFCQKCYDNLKLVL